MKRLFGFVGTLLLALCTYTYTGAKLLLDSVGRVSAFQDIRDKQGYTAKALDWLFATPWYIPGILTIAVTAALLLFFYKAIFPDNQLTKTDKTTSLIRVNTAYSQISASVFNQSTQEVARYVFETNKTLNNVEVYLEYSTFYNAIGGGWTKPNRLNLGHFDRVPKGERKTIYIIGLSSVIDNGKTKAFAKFGEIDENRHLILKDQFYRCRMSLLYNDDQEHYTYFVTYMQNDDIGPLVFGQHLFYYSDEWERGVRDTNSEALFS